MALWFRGVASYEREESSRLTFSRATRPRGNFPSKLRSWRSFMPCVRSTAGKTNLFRKKLRQLCRKCFSQGCQSQSSHSRTTHFPFSRYVQKKPRILNENTAKMFSQLNGYTTLHYTTLKFHLYTVPRIAFPRMVTFKY